MSKQSAQSIIIISTYLSSLSAFFFWLFSFGNHFLGMAIFWMITTAIVAAIGVKNVNN